MNLSNNRQSILIFAHSYSTQFIDICNQYSLLFDKLKYKTMVVYLTGSPNTEVQKRTFAEQVIFMDTPVKMIRGLKLGVIKQIFSLCRKEKFQIVICHRFKPSYIMMWVSYFCRIPALICVMHELGTLKRLSRKVSLSFLFRKNMLLAGVSDSVRDNMRTSVPFISQERIITLYNSIDMPFTESKFSTRARARKQLKIPDDAFVFGHIGRLAPNKDQKSLIQAFACIQTQHPNAQLIIIGDGILESELQNEVKTLKLTEKIIFTGFLSEAYQYLKAFDVFVLPSIQEAFGRVLTEAMTARIPVISTRVHGIPEVIGQFGILIEAHHPEMLAEAMMKTIHWNPEKRDQMTQQAYTRTQSLFSIPSFQKKFWDLPLIQSIEEEEACA